MPWWLDVLEWGQKSPHAQSFDIDWEGLPVSPAPRRAAADPRPTLRRRAAGRRDRTEIRRRGRGSFAAWYFEHKLPINPQRYSEMLRNHRGARPRHDEPRPTG